MEELADLVFLWNILRRSFYIEDPLKNKSYPIISFFEIKKII